MQRTANQTILVTAGVLSATTASFSLAADLHVPSEYPNIQAAVAAAQDFDRIILAEQTFVGPGNRDIVLIGKRIVIQSTNPDDPDVVANTIVDCEAMDVAFRVLEENESKLYGFTMMNGYSVQGPGGLLYIEDSSPWVKDCNLWYGYSGGLGGAVHCYSSTADKPSNPFFENCNFSYNMAENDGGAVYINWNCNPVFGYCVFDGNISDADGNGQGEGGAVFIDGGEYRDGKEASRPGFQGCSFTNNMATGYDGGAITIKRFTVAYLYNCDFSWNWSAGNGGALYASSSHCQPDIRGCTFSENVADGTGGALAFEYGAHPEMFKCTIERNVAGDDGGGLSFRDAICDIPDRKTLEQCTVRENSAPSGGGGIHSVASQLFLDRCWITDNQAASGGGIYSGNGDALLVMNSALLRNRATANGGAMMIKTHADVVGSTFWGNSANVDGGAVCVWHDASPIFLNSILWNDMPREIDADRGSLYIDYSVIEGGYSGTGNLSDDPMLVDPMNDDVHLGPGTTCWDAGDPTYIPLPNELDIYGDERLLVDAVDIGADELTQPRTICYGLTLTVSSTLR